jgi:hypothetical protein
MACVLYVCVCVCSRVCVCVRVRAGECVIARVRVRVGEVWRVLASQGEEAGGVVV